MNSKCSVLGRWAVSFGKWVENSGQNQLGRSVFHHWLNEWDGNSGMALRLPQSLFEKGAEDNPLYPGATIHQFPAHHAFAPESPTPVFAGTGQSLFHVVLPVVYEEIVQLNMDRAYRCASATQRTGITQVAKFFLSFEVWVQGGSDGATVRRIVGMSPDGLVDRADIQAGATADAVQGFALPGIGQHIGATIIQQYHIHLFRSICFTFPLLGPEKSVLYTVTF